jgi:tRNA threonylcarbamoyladenosine modification (KEOPS) complex  Pcc1 subunit
MVTEEGDAEDIVIKIDAEDAAGNMGTASVTMVKLDNTAPVITAPSADMSNVMAGDSVMISAMVEGATSVSADASGLNADASMLELTSTDGMSYSGSVMVTEEGDAEDIVIKIDAEDAAGNMGTASVTMVKLDNTAPVITAPSADMSNVMAGDSVMISAMVEGATSVSADASGLNADASMLELTSTDGMSYSGSVMVTEEGDGEVTITITAWSLLLILQLMEW